MKVINTRNYQPGHFCPLLRVMNDIIRDTIAKAKYAICNWCDVLKVDHPNVVGCIQLIYIAQYGIISGHDNE